MAAAPPTVTLITGSNRGLGFGFLQTVLQRPNNIVIAAVRDPASKSSQSLLALPTGQGSKVQLVKIDSTVETDAAEAVKTLEESGIDYIDRVIANAGIADDFMPVLNMDLGLLRKHMDVNLYGVIALFKAVTPLLKKSKDPKVFTLATDLGRFGKIKDMAGPWFAYGVTKAAIHFMSLQLHLENDWLTSVALNPGWARSPDEDPSHLENFTGMRAPQNFKETVEACISNVVDAASRENFSGQIVRYTGEIDSP